MLSAVDVVLVALRGTLGLGGQIRQACVDAARGRSLVLPLPGFFPDADDVSASNYFAADGAAHAVNSFRLRELLKKRGGAGLTDDERRELCEFHASCAGLDRAASGRPGRAEDGTVLAPGNLAAVLTVAQWSRDTDPRPSVLRRLAGALVETGADVLRNVPGAMQPGTRHAEAAAGFLEALEGLDLPAGPLDEAVPRLFVAAMETVSEDPVLLGGGSRVRALVRASARSVGEAVSRRIGTIRAAGGSDSVRESGAAAWGELVFRGLLSGAGREVMENPARFLGAGDPGREALAGRVGRAVLDLLLDPPGGAIGGAFGREGVESLLRSAIAAVAEHPELLDREDAAGLPGLLRSVAGRLAASKHPLAFDLLPEVACLVLQWTARHPGWASSSGISEPSGQLLACAAGHVFDAFAGESTSGGFRLGRGDLLAVVETVMDAASANPACLSERDGAAAGGLKAALLAARGALAAVDGRRLGPGVAVDVLREAFRAVARRREFLDVLPGPGTGGGRSLLAVALESILSALFDDRVEARAAWQLGRTETVTAVVRTGLDEMARARIVDASVAILRDVLARQVRDLVGGKAFDPEAFAAALRAALAVA
jgi:hypothetical protein